MNQKEFLSHLEETFADCLELSQDKNDDYAGKENSDPFANFKNAETVGVDVARGILVRLMDKISRIDNLLDGERSVEDERLEDTIHDAINYLAILKAWQNK